MVSHPKTHGNSQIARPFQAMQPGVPVHKDLLTILRTEYPPMRWLIPDILPWGFSLFAAGPKSGKSMVALWAAMKIGTTAPAAGQLPPGVLIVSPDDTDEGGIKERAQGMLGGAPIDAGRINFWFYDVERLDSGLLLQIGAYLDVHPECVLVIIDVYNSVKPERKIDDIQRHDHSAMHEIREFGQRHDVSVLLLNHTTTRPKRRFQQGAGSNGLGGGAQGILELERDEFGEMVTLYRRGRRVRDAAYRFSLDDLCLDFMPIPLDVPPEEMTPEQVQAEAEAAAREREEDEKRKRPRVPGTIEQKLLDLLADGHEWAPKALAEAAEVCRKTARWHLYRMRQRAQVEMLRYGVYRLPQTPQTPQTLCPQPGNSASGNHEAPAASVGSVGGIGPLTHAYISPAQTPPKAEYFGRRMRRYLAQGMSRKKAEELALQELQADVEAGRW